MNEKEVLEEENKPNEELDNHKSKIRDEISKLEDGLRVLIKEREEIIASEEYNQLLKLRDKRKEIELETQKLKDRIYANFSIFGRPFKKYKRNAKQYEKIIENYETDALNALLTDPELRIVEVLREMSKSIERGELRLKDRNTQKIMKQISRMNQQYFEDFLKEYNPIIDNKERIEGKIRENNAEEKIDKIHHRQDSIKSEIDQMKQELELEKHGFPKKLKPCPKCGKEIPVNWHYHEECGWEENKEEKSIDIIRKVKIEVFTSPTCPHCHPALNLAKQIEKGSFPILGYSYYEYATALKDKEKHTALLYAEYGIELSNLEIYFPQKKPFEFKVNFLTTIISLIVVGVCIFIAKDQHKRRKITLKRIKP